MLEPKRTRFLCFCLYSIVAHAYLAYGKYFDL